MDFQIFTWLNHFAGNSVWLDRVFVFCAEYLPFLLVAIFVWLVLRSAESWQSKRYGAALAFLSAGISRGFITEAIRLVYNRPRPFVDHAVNLLISKDGSGSFPSGHAAFFFAFAAAVWVYNKKWGNWFMLGTVVMGISRVIVGVHYPLDILGGAVIGFVSVYISEMILKYPRVRKLLAL